MLDSVTAYKKYGIQPSKLRFMIQNIFYFPEEYKDCLCKYTYDEYNTKSFLSQMKEGMFIVPEDKATRSYQVIYHKTDPTKLLRRKEHTRVKLSFRVAQPEFNILPTVLVKEIIE